jgi:hypothetical protein
MSRTRWSISSKLGRDLGGSQAGEHLVRDQGTVPLVELKRLFDDFFDSSHPSSQAASRGPRLTAPTSTADDCYVVSGGNNGAFGSTFSVR